MNSNSMEIGAEGLMLIPRVLKILPPTLYTKGRERIGLYISNTSNIWNIWYDFNFGGCIPRSFVGYSHLDQTSLFNKFISLKALHCDTLNHRKGCKLKIQRCARKIEILNEQMNESWIKDIFLRFQPSTSDFHCENAFLKWDNSGCHNYMLCLKKVQSSTYREANICLK